MRQFDEYVMKRPSGLQWGLPKIVSSPCRTSSRTAPLARSCTSRRSGPSRFERKASCLPSGERSAWYSVAPLERTRRAAPPPAGTSQIW